MKKTPILVSLCAVILMACFSAGCSNSDPIPPISDAVQEDNVLTTDASPQQGTPPPSTAPEVSPPPVSTVGEVSPPPSSPIEEAVAPPASPAEPVTGPAEDRYSPRTGNGVDVIYFEAKTPCSCMVRVGITIETAILTHFQDELQSGELRYFVIVSNLPENNDLVDMFDAQVYGLSIAEFRDGQMMAQSVDEVWMNKDSPSKLADLVQTRILSSLEALR